MRRVALCASLMCAALPLAAAAEEKELNHSIFAEKGTLAKTSGGCVKVLIFPAK